MYNIELSLVHENLFCPVTGQKVLHEEEYTPSKAQMFCYLENDCVFQYLDESLLDLANKYGLDEEYMDFEDFELFLKEFSNKNTWVDFVITSSGLACGPVSMVVHHCFDMNYSEEE